MEPESFEKTIHVRLKYIYIFFLFLLGQGLAAQKAFKQIKSNLKSGKAVEALSEIKALAADSSWTGDPRLYVLGVEANLLLYAAQNEKAYLKQQMDTAAFFSSTYGVCDYVLRTDSADREQLVRGGKLKYRARNAGWIVGYYSNLEKAIIYYFRKKNYVEAERFAALCLKVSDSDLWRSIPDAPGIKRDYLAMRYVQCCYLQNKYAQVVEASELALKDSLHRRLTLEYLALSYKELGDTERYEQTLHEAVADFPGYLPFFSYLLEKLLEEGRNEEALAFCDSLIVRMGADKELLYGKCLSLLALGRWENLIAVSEKVLELDSEEKMANYFIGLSWCNLASAVRLPASITSKTYKEAQAQQRKYYQFALPHLERYREGCPDDKDRWAPLLYQAYLALNMGKKFEEIQKIM